MIQVCSRCGTRWNVRANSSAVGVRAATDRCWHRPPRRWVRRPPDRARPVPDRPAGRPPASAGRSVRRDSDGSRCGRAPPPAPRRRRRPLGPTPRYQTIPRWGWSTRTGPAAAAATDSPAGRSASPTAVRVTMLVTSGVLAVAALAHVLRYVLLLINRTTLLPPLVANGSLLMGCWSAWRQSSRSSPPESQRRRGSSPGGLRCSGATDSRTLVPNGHCGRAAWCPSSISSGHRSSSRS